jgi:DNA end-binding protein Ku
MQNNIMRSIWKGSIGFGLVNIPVRMYSATDESTISFDLLDKKSGSRIRYKKVVEATGKEAAATDIVKGYKMGSGYVLMEDADFEKAAPEKIDHIEITEFVLEKEIDSIYFEKPYYLEPDKIGSRSYALLREALKKEGKAAVGRMVYRNKEWICLIKPSDNVLVLNRLRFSEEIRSVDGLTIPDATVKAEELKMASTLIAQLTKPFKPERFKDEYTEKILKVIEAKSKGKSTNYKPLKVVHTNTTEDLMEKLKASLKTVNKKAS